MNDDTLLFYQIIRNFLTVYLPKQRGTSKNTIKSYKEAINLLLAFLCEKYDKKLSDLSFELISEQDINDYLEWLEVNRNYSVNSRNQRLYAIKSFFKYAGEKDSTLMTVYLKISAIPNKIDHQPHEIEFFSENAVKVLLEQPNPAKKNGKRDLVFMILLYDTGARIQELLDLKLKDIFLDERCPYIVVTGKGSKTRSIPIMKKTCEHIKLYLEEFHSASTLDEYLFYVDRSGSRSQMSADNVEKFISKYAKMGHEISSDIPEHIYPHMWRHSRAMHLYRNGMPLPLVAEWLGHANTETTRKFYANADTIMKKEAIEKATSSINALKEDTTIEWANDDEMIKKLYCLS